MEEIRGMHLGLSMRRLGYHIAAWRHPDVQADGQEDLAFFVESARLAEAAKFDFVFLADGLAVRADDTPPGSLATSHENVEFEPTTLLAALAPQTSHIGLIATASTTYNEPFHIARRFASLDHISGGRAGWNIVTSWSEQEAWNFNRAEHLDRETRYERAAEFVDVVAGLWESWEAGAFLRDKDSGRFYDEDKLHVLNHRGQHFSVRGPLTCSRTPQGRPVVVHAGASPAGIEIAARHADLVYTNDYDIEVARDFRARLRKRTAEMGRDPDSIKVMVGVQPVIGATRAAAEAQLAELQALVHPLAAMAGLINLIGDLDELDLDAPFPESFALSPRSTSNAQKALQLGRSEGLTPRELSMRLAGRAGLRQIVGTAEDVADDLERWFQGGACDGFNLCPTHSHTAIRQFTERVVPILQDRGLFRKDYTGKTLREHLGAAAPSVIERPSAYATAVN
ncbi:LLM class flavin-dependent oxidoreductase (plasmid) [Salipiger sp. H15]|uniref:LLM class flavin-dependent oxidoreductase n=1 Tax=Alloyangia sp. H15 TaxID=3029062 RepID=A0AAU8AQY1_9RHOB